MVACNQMKYHPQFFTFQSLFRVIRPQKVLFLAVDGVAPRAKMNQQRGRRFHSAREAQDLIHKAQQKGKLLPLELCFDSNCSTPGTDFMSRLHEQLMYFINQKLNSDPPWQRVKAILSGHDVSSLFFYMYVCVHLYVCKLICVCLYVCMDKCFALSRKS